MTVRPLLRNLITVNALPDQTEHGVPTRFGHITPLFDTHTAKPCAFLGCKPRESRIVRVGEERRIVVAQPARDLGSRPKIFASR